MSVLRVRSAVRAAVCAVVASLSLVTIGAVTMPFAAAAEPDPRVDLRVLVLTDSSEWVKAIAGELDAEGVPYTQVDLTSATRPAITAAYLSDVVGSVPRAKFQAVVLPNEAPTQLTAAELTALHTFEARSLTLTALVKGQPHRFTVAAVNASGTSGYSAASNTVYPR
jgi:hypothetical protein